MRSKGLVKVMQAMHISRSAYWYFLGISGLLFGVLGGPGCSLANREGPDETCAELGNGAKNACRDGIIASCLDGKTVQYNVCTNEVEGTKPSDLCSASWQVPGQYSCDRSQPAVPDAGTVCPAECLGGVCLEGQCAAFTLATRDDTDQNPTAIAVDESYIYWGGERAFLKKVPKSGGGLIGLAPIPARQVEQRGSFVYWIHSNDIYRISKQGGDWSSPLAKTVLAYNFALDESHLYYIKGAGLFRMSIDGGESVNICTDPGTPNSRIAADNEYVYWISNCGSSYRRFRIGGRA